MEVKTRMTGETYTPYTGSGPTSATRRDNARSVASEAVSGNLLLIPSHGTFRKSGSNPTQPTPVVLVLDIDDTVLRHHPRKPDYIDPESVLENCRPILAACERAQRLIEEGFEVHFVTGRSAVVKRATLAQLKTWISTRVLAEHVHCNGSWAGYDALQEHKAERLRALGAVLMVGDHAADEAAAMDAGIPFLHADAFAAGAPLPLATPSPLLSVN